MAALATVIASAGAGAEGVRPFMVEGDTIPSPLRGLAGDARRGEAVVRNRETGNCLICHAIPVAAERFQGDIGPPLAGVGSRLSPGQIRLRVVDPTLINEQAIMPPYHRTAGLVRVDPRHAGQPALSAQEVEDVVAYLASLREP